MAQMHSWSSAGDLRVCVSMCVCVCGWRPGVTTEGALHPLIDRQKMHMKKMLKQNEVIKVDWDIY